VPNDLVPTNLVIRCANTACDFTRDRPLPILTVDQPIYRRLPAFLIATVDKFASLPWVGETGAFFGHVDRFVEGIGFYGANDARREGRPLDNGWKLDPPDLIIQDELHLIAGPLGTVAGLYETAIDQLASRVVNGQRIRPKIVGSTATVRRASEQISALFDRGSTSVFPPPGIDRTDSFFARTVPSTRDPARLYLQRDCVAPAFQILVGRDNRGVRQLSRRLVDRHWPHRLQPDRPGLGPAKQIIAQHSLALRPRINR
jgi:hypothetical protein